MRRSHCRLYHTIAGYPKPHELHFSMHLESKRRLCEGSDTRPRQPNLLFARINITANHLAQLIFFGELSAQNLEVINQVLATVDKGFFGCNLAICLDAQLECRKERMRD